MKLSENTCRICLQSPSESIVMKSVFDNDLDEEVKISDKIYLTSGIFIEEKEHFPNKICNICNNNLIISYNFRETCQLSDEKLKILESSGEIYNKNIKCEINFEVEQKNEDELNDKDSWQETSLQIDSKDFLDKQILDDFSDKYSEKNEESEEDYKPKVIKKKKNTKKVVKNNDADDKSSTEKKPRRYCLFKTTWTIKYDWLKQGKGKSGAFCSICDSEFSVGHGGEGVIIQHMNRAKHIFNLNPNLRKEKVFRGNGIKCPQNLDELQYIMCEICGNKYPTQRHLRRHLKYHTDVMEHECEICKKQFRELMQLKRHMRVHTGEKPYACKYCDKRFGDYSSRLKHERTHTNERPYVCETCGKSFTYSNILKNHILIHTGEKAFRCDTCDTNFSRKTHLKQHMDSMLHKSRVKNATT